MMIIGYGQLGAAILLLISACVMWSDGHIILPVLCVLAALIFIRDGIDFDDDDDGFDGSVLLTR